MTTFMIPALNVGETDLHLNVAPPAYELKRGDETLVSGEDYRPGAVVKSEQMTAADCAVLIANVYEAQLDDSIREALELWASDVEEGRLEGPVAGPANRGGYAPTGPDADVLVAVATAAAHYCVGHDLGTIQAQVEIIDGALANTLNVPTGKFVVIGGGIRREYGDFAAALVSYSALKVGYKSLWEITPEPGPQKLWLST